MAPCDAQELIAELRARIAQFEKHNRDTEARIHQYGVEIGQLIAENQRLRADSERVVMQKYLHSPSGTQPHADGDWYYVPHVDAEIARLRAEAFQLVEDHQVEADLLKAALRWLHGELQDCMSCRGYEVAATPPEFAAVIAEAVGSKT